MSKRQLYYQVLNFAMVVSSALMLWKGLLVLTGSESPFVVGLSGRVEPAFLRGDLRSLTNFREDPTRAGEIVAFKVEGRDIPVVHRVIKVQEKDNGDIKFLTKGDNNEVDNRGLYKEGQNWLGKKDVVGRARGFSPYVGVVAIIMNDYPKFKYALLAVMGAYGLLLKHESRTTKVGVLLPDEMHCAKKEKLIYLRCSSFCLKGPSPETFLSCPNKRFLG
ncbi:signal peptidase complex catalytic subunit SEC11C-like [Echinops telfairi]|uniref:Signal peptidase complex catalytic subunit SEC11C-like n=1 Tax=Echinops telfairi TaxID=9371 RepID=A0AC55CYU2_ECHTE|nr:signal peptidase complex catalytic subunit SEC11C-like [Echinops telfairi]